MGLWGRIPACVWVIKLAICGDKHMATLATLWKANIEVCFVHQRLFRRRCGTLFRRRSGGVPAICFNTRWKEIGSNDLPLFFQAIQLVVDTKQVVHDARDHPADVWLGGDSPRVCGIIGISPAPQVGSLYNEPIWDSDARV